MKFQSACHRASTGASLKSGEFAQEGETTPPVRGRKRRGAGPRTSGRMAHKVRPVRPRPGACGVFHFGLMKLLGAFGPGSNSSPGVIRRAVLAALLGAAIAIFPACGDDDGEGSGDGGLSFAEPAELTNQAKEDLAAALDALPSATGFTDADKTRSLLGVPDVFELWFEVGDTGQVVRSETWYYLDLEVSYEFRDGALLFTIPMDEVAGLILPALQYDPLAFDASTSLDDVRDMLDDPDVLTPEEIREEYALDVTVWAGEQLIAAFDANGDLLYIETVAIELGGGQ